MKRTSSILTALLLAPLAVKSHAELPQASARDVETARPPAWIVADYILPAYVNLPAATLLVRATDTLRGSPIELRVAFQPRQGGAAPCAEMLGTLRPGEELRLPVRIAGWADGDYRTEIRCLREGRALGEPLARWLRKQTIPAPLPPAEPIKVRGLTTLFVDNEYVHSQSGLRRAVNPAETFAVTTGRLGPDRPIQKASEGIRLEPDGTWIVKFTDEEREDRTGATTRHYTARSRDARAWKVSEDVPAESHPRTKSTRKKQATQPSLRPVQLLAAAPAGDPPHPRFRFYDPAADGPANIRQVRLRHTGLTRNAHWGEIAMPYRAVFPVWEKSPAEHLILTREPLLQDKHDQPDGAPCDWGDTNDNYLNDFHNPDGRTMFYGQARMILRHDPFRIPFDAFKTFPGGNYNRIMAVWRSRDGLRWTPTFLDPQQEDDPFSYQCYGANQFYVEERKLSLCYFFAYRAELQQVCVELRYSRDNIRWQRLPGRLEDNIFAANGPWGSWNFGYMHGMIGAPVEKDGEMLHLFASCQNVPHHFFRSLLGYNAKVISDPEWLQTQFKKNDLPRYPFWKEMGGWEGFAHFAPQACRPVGGMRYRKDGWVALRPTGRKGELVTKALLAGDQLAINARTRPGGCVRVEVLDADCQPLPGFSGANAASFAGDSVHAPLTWENGAQSRLPALPLRLRIRLDNAELFALHFAPAPAIPDTEVK